MTDGPYLLGIDFGTGERGSESSTLKGRRWSLANGNIRSSTRVLAGPSRTPMSGGRAWLRR